MLGEATEATNEMQAGDNALGSFKLSLIVPGLSKCGTSTLCAMLAQHPQIAFSNPKEPLFFCNSDYENLWSYYFSVFPPPNDRLVFGEGSDLACLARPYRRQQILDTHQLLPRRNPRRASAGDFPGGFIQQS